MSLATDHSPMYLTQAIAPRPGFGSGDQTGAILHTLVTRSEAVRLAPVISALQAAGVPQMVSRPAARAQEHPFDPNGIPVTERFVGFDSTSGVQRTAHALAAAEQTLLTEEPAMVVVGGDADASLAFGLAASKLGIPIARVGGGGRCGDFSNSEEINRILGDRLADLIFTDSPDAADALESEGIPRLRVQHVGNTTIDLLHRFQAEARRAATARSMGLDERTYVLVTLHRRENLRDHERVRSIAAALGELAERYPVVFPLHPMTRAVMEPMGALAHLEKSGVRVLESLPYLSFLSLEQTAGAIVTDAGAVQDESSALGVRCYTLRQSTDRVVTLTHGTNVLIGDDPGEISLIRIDDQVLAPASIALWDGHASERVARHIVRRLAGERRESLTAAS